MFYNVGPRQDCTVDGKPVFGTVESEYVSSHFIRL
jgi:hypothetical protein